MPLEPLMGVERVVVPRAMNLARSRRRVNSSFRGSGGRLGKHVPLRAT